MLTYNLFLIFPYHQVKLLLIGNRLDKPFVQFFKGHFEYFHFKSFGTIQLCTIKKFAHVLYQ